MRKSQDAWVYILANLHSKTLYVGVTNNLERRLAEHRSPNNDGFTSRYGVTALVYCERSSSITDAIAREKQLKKWSKAKKMALIEKGNPRWRDLSKSWGKEGR